MFFTKIRLIGLSTIDFPISGTTTADPYILKSADGLGPPDIDVFIANTRSAGGVYQGKRTQSREIVLSIGLNADYSIGQTVSDLRNTLYGLLTPSFEDIITIQLMDEDEVLFQTTGSVKKLEISPFAKDPSVQVTIPCVQPYFDGPSVIHVIPASKAAPVITNLGTAPTGFRMGVLFTAPVTNWTLSDSSGGKMEITYSFLSGDLLVINTNPGSRGIWLTRSAVTTNIIYALSSDSLWYMLHGGANTFATNSQTFDWDDVYYRPVYWGI